MTVRILVGDVIARLADIPDNSVHCCVSSPPYWGLRDYGVPGQLGLESTPAEFIEKMVLVFAEVHRVLRADGTCWVNMGDSYAGNGAAYGSEKSTLQGRRQDGMMGSRRKKKGGGNLKPKDLCMMPHRLAIALQDWGWWVRQDIVWAKPNPMPESVADRCTKAHEYIFLITKSAKYYYDADAIREPAKELTGQAATFARSGPVSEHILPGQSAAQHRPRGVGFGHGTDAESRQRGWISKEPTIPAGWATGTNRKHTELAGNFSQFRGSGGISKPGYDDEKWDTRHDGVSRPPMTMKDRVYNPLGRNKRSVWTMATHSFSEAHFATFPPELPETCILAGTSEYGCCAACGAQYTRSTTSKFIPQQDVSEENGVRGAGDQKPLDASNNRDGYPRGNKLVQTTGWEAGCECVADVIRPVVLDPFFGAGTTGLVADRLQRDCIGIELNPIYAEMASKRIAGESTLFAQITVEPNQEPSCQSNKIAV